MMKNKLTIALLFLLCACTFGQIGNNPTKFNNGIQLSNSTEKLIFSDSIRIPILDENEILNGWINKDSLKTDLSEYYTKSEIDTLYTLDKALSNGNISDKPLYLSGDQNTNAWRLAVFPPAGSTKLKGGQFSIYESEDGYLNIGMNPMGTTGTRSTINYFGRDNFRNLTKANITNNNMNGLNAFGEYNLMNIEKGSFLSVFGYKNLMNITEAKSSNIVGFYWGNNSTTVEFSNLFGTGVQTNDPLISIKRTNLFGDGVGTGFTSFNEVNIIGTYLKQESDPDNLVGETILSNYSKGISFRTYGNGLTVTPRQTQITYDNDTTGKAVVTKEILSNYTPPLQNLQSVLNIGDTVNNNTINFKRDADDFQLTVGTYDEFAVTDIGLDLSGRTYSIGGKNISDSSAKSNILFNSSGYIDIITDGSLRMSSSGEVNIGGNGGINIGGGGGINIGGGGGININDELILTNLAADASETNVLTIDDDGNVGSQKFPELDKYIPLSGTVVNKPITGHLVLDSPTNEGNYTISSADDFQLLSDGNYGFLITYALGEFQLKADDGSKGITADYEFNKVGDRKAFAQISDVQDGDSVAYKNGRAIYTLTDDAVWTTSGTQSLNLNTTIDEDIWTNAYGWEIWWTDQSVDSVIADKRSLTHELGGNSLLNIVKGNRKIGGGFELNLDVKATLTIPEGAKLVIYQL